MSEKTIIPELLAPAGNRDAFFAALAAGADAVYFGVSDFNARRGADNFLLDDLRELCDIAHLAERRVYLTLNTVVKESEFEQALELGRQAWARGVDAVIVQDLGLLRALARAVPNLKLHASTQLNAHSSADIKALAKLGVARVTLARELSVSEIQTLSARAADLGVETEVFAHGALCFCYSGQCYMSSIIGQRSANRGLCAQPCRLPWKLIDTSTGRAVATPGEHLLSAGDLCSLPLLSELATSGAASLKIEGRMKSATYVSTATQAYRVALDSGGSLDAASDELAEVFSRSFTAAYLENNRSNTMMSYQRPNNRGTLVGRITELKGAIIGIELTRAVERGDKLEVWTTKGNKVVTLEDFYDGAGAKGAPLASAPAKSTIYLEIRAGVSKGDRVFRVYNNALEQKTQQSLEKSLFAGRGGLVPVAFEVKLRLGKPLEVRVSLPNRDVAAIAAGPLVEAARTKALTVDDVIEHVCRVGGTPFSVDDCTVELDEGVGLGFAALHACRTEALAKLSEAICAPWHERRLAPQAAYSAPAPARRGKVQLAVLVRNAEGARAAAKAGAKVIYGHAVSLDLEGAALDFAAASEKAASPAKSSLKSLSTGASKSSKSSSKKPALKVQPQAWFPSIIHDKNQGSFAHFFAETTQMSADVDAAPAFVANNLGALCAAGTAEVTAEAGPSLPALNSEALALLAQCGAQMAWLSPELSYEDLEQLAPSAPLPLGIAISGFQELMVSEHCVLMAQGDCAEDCARCTRRKTPRLLEDRKGYRFPVRTDEMGRSHIYNAIPLDLFGEVPKLLSLGITNFLVDATLLGTSEIAEEVQRAVRAVNLAVRDAGVLPKREGYTTGHLYRGVR
ncbi:MAG: U32 family peptidase [Coriobacteriales bacterium]|jgi:putative protease|nr:U32 family peptidase [Coriobacteriales bacterium]